MGDEKRLLYEIIFALCGVISLQARIIWRVVRQRNYSRELLVREKQSRTHEHNETISIICEAYASAEPATLDDLLSRRERDFQARSSKRPRDL